MNEFVVNAAAAVTGIIQHPDQLRAECGIFLLTQPVICLAERILGFGLGGKPIQLLCQPDDLCDGADLIALSAIGIAGSVPALHVLLAGFADHQPRDILGCLPSVVYLR